MLGTIIYIIGLVLAIKAVLEILKMPIGLVGKVLSSVLVLCCSWVAWQYTISMQRISWWIGLNNPLIF